MRKLTVLLLILMLTLSIVGCDKNTAKPVAVVNGAEISKTEFEKRLNQSALMYGIDLNSEQAKSIKPMLEDMIINQLIDENLMLQDAKQKNLTVNDDVINSKVNEVKENYKDSFTEQLKQLNMTEKDYREMIKNQLIIEKLYEELTKDVSDKEINVKDYYEEHTNEFIIPEQVKARHILLATQADAVEIIKQLDNGSDFAELAKTKSIDPSAKSNEGDLGYFDRNANLVPEFIEGTFMLKVGEITREPVMTQFGWHIIKVEDKIESKLQSFDEVKEQLQQDLLLEAKHEKFEKYVSDLKESASIINNIKNISQSEIQENNK